MQFVRQFLRIAMLSRQMRPSLLSAPTPVVSQRICVSAVAPSIVSVKQDHFLKSSLACLGQCVDVMAIDLSVGCGGNGRFGRPFLDAHAGCLYGSRAQHLDGNIGRRGEPHGVEGERDARRAAQRREFGSGQGSRTCFPRSWLYSRDGCNPGIRNSGRFPNPSVRDWPDRPAMPRLPRRS